MLLSETADHHRGSYAKLGQSSQTLTYLAITAKVLL